MMMMMTMLVKNLLVLFVNTYIDYYVRGEILFKEEFAI